MKFLVLILLSLILSSVLKGQNSNSNIEAGSLSSSLLETLILKKINAHRAEKKLIALKNAPSLALAAANHSAYQGTTKQLTHEQDSFLLKTPSLRVINFGGKFNLVGENVAFVSVRASSTYASIAEDFFQAWMNSPPHYENIIEPDYRNSGIRFRFSKDAKTGQKILYATHVFGGPKSKFFSKVTVPEDAYGLKPYNDLCLNYAHVKHLSEVLAQFLLIKEDSIFIHYHNLEQIEKFVLRYKNHGLAIDIVERKQFPCNSPNLTNETGAHKGILLSPKFRDELLKNNPLKDQKQFVGFLGKLPKGLVKEYQLNVINIYQKCACVNSSYLHIPNNDIPLVPIMPVWHTKTKIKKLGSKEVTHKIPFKQGRATLDTEQIATIKELYQTQQGNIQRVHIFATSSVEGNSSDNKKLGIARAQFIKKIIEEMGFGSNKINYHTLERWDMFRTQIKGTPFAFLLPLSNQAIQQRLNSDQELAQKIEHLLAQERMTQLTFKVSTDKDFLEIPDSEEHLLAKFEQYLAAKDLDNALAVQSKMIYALVNDKLARENLLSSKIPMEKAYIPLLSNQMTVELFFGEYIPHSVFISNWGDPFFSVSPNFSDKLVQLAGLSKNDLPLQYNLSAFAIKYMRYTHSSFMNVAELYKNILQFGKKEIYGPLSAWNTAEIKQLKLNFHLAATDYFYQQHEYKKRENSLKYILKHYLKQSTEANELLFLAKYFNKNFRFQWAINLLENGLKDHPTHEDMFFTYLQTLILFENTNPLSEGFVSKLQKALKMNPQRLCQWIESNYQLLHFPHLKNLYCKNCLAQ